MLFSSDESVLDYKNPDKESTYVFTFEDGSARFVCWKPCYGIVFEQPLKYSIEGRKIRLSDTYFEKHYAELLVFESSFQVVSNKVALPFKSNKLVYSSCEEEITFDVDFDRCKYSKDKDISKEGCF